MIKQQITALVLAILFCVAAHFLLGEHREYVLNQQRLLQSTIKAESLTEYQGELAKMRFAWDRAGRFVEHARSLGLERNKWASYHVNIEEPVFFPEFAQILKQTANSESYYFKPATLHVKTNIESDVKTTKKNQGSVSSGPHKTKTGDVLLTLKGAFVIRSRCNVQKSQKIRD